MADEFDPETVVEAVARAMCQVACRTHDTPDDPALIPDDSRVRGVRTGKAWELFRQQALMHIKAHYALKNAILEAAKAV
jgi:hypothetical protein